MNFVFTTILTLVLSFLINSQIVSAEEVDNSNILEKDSSNNIENVKENEKSSKVKRSEGDIFGDEQTFPFVAGLGKNAAH
tara:strand:- start:973 stop:1212 length:240 start_codon:yes stop_codon:yes gene_type:complete